MEAMTNGTHFLPVEKYKLYQKLEKNRRIIIAGGRDFTDYNSLAYHVSEYRDANSVHDCIIVSGTARGADKLGELYAINYALPIKEFPADWDKHGKAAGHIRNKEMAEYAGHLIAFWDGKSRGTANMIKQAEEHGLKIQIIYYNQALDGVNSRQDDAAASSVSASIT
jgi:YspA, cpYpsA-related SLOG family